MTVRAALYHQMSPSDKSTNKQRRELEKFCAQQDWKIVETYQDVGRGGAKGSKNRPALDQMFKDARRGIFDIAVFTSVDRLGGSTAQIARNMADLKAHGVHQAYLKEAIDTSTDQGSAMLEMATVFAKLDKSITQDRVKAGIAKRKKEGLGFGRPTISKVKEMHIKLLRQEGMGILKIAKAVGCGVSAVQRVVKNVEAEDFHALGSHKSASHNGNDDLQLDLLGH